MAAGVDRPRYQDGRPPDLPRRLPADGRRRARAARAPWRHDLIVAPAGVRPLCDSDSPQPMAGDATLDDAAWYRFVAPTGDSRSSAPSARRRRPGVRHRRAGMAGERAPGGGRSAGGGEGRASCTGVVRRARQQKTVHMCACSFDGGATAVYHDRTSCRRRPTRADARGSAGDAAPEAAEAAAAAALDARIGRLAAALTTVPLMLNSSRDRPFRTRDWAPPPARARRRHRHRVDDGGAHAERRRSERPSGERRLRRDAAGAAGGTATSRTPSAATLRTSWAELGSPLRRWSSSTRARRASGSSNIGASPSACTWRRCTRTTKSPTSTRSGRRRATAAGGTNVSVVGRRFDVLHGLHGVACRFGTTVVAAHHKNDTHVLCASPPGLPSGAHSFALTLNGHDFTAGGPAAAAFTVPRVARRHRANARRAAGGARDAAARRRLRRRRRHGLRRVGGGGRPAPPLRRRVGGGARDECHPRRRRLPSGGADAEVHGAQVDGADAMPYGDGRPAAAGGRRPRRAALETASISRARCRSRTMSSRRFCRCADRRAVFTMAAPSSASTARASPKDQNGTYIEQWGASAIAQPRSTRARPAAGGGDGRTLARCCRASAGGPALVDARARRRRRRDARGGRLRRRCARGGGATTSCGRPAATPTRSSCETRGAAVDPSASTPPTVAAVGGLRRRHINGGRGARRVSCLFGRTARRRGWAARRDRRPAAPSAERGRGRFAAGSGGGRRRSCSWGRRRRVDAPNPLRARCRRTDCGDVQSGAWGRAVGLRLHLPATAGSAADAAGSPASLRRSSVSSATAPTAARSCASGERNARPRLPSPPSTLPTPSPAPPPPSATATTGADADGARRGATSTAGSTTVAYARDGQCSNRRVPSRAGAGLHDCGGCTAGVHALPVEISVNGRDGGRPRCVHGGAARTNATLDVLPAAAAAPAGARRRRRARAAPVVAAAGLRRLRRPRRRAAALAPSMR